ncbi:hypothetical protein PMKS-001791 [Pichia membranifaciens]|uniref:Uncharacterized protein n=1 Tax=Pichia membranifaciens TaxID=4926 RepID=A0A1Q2YFH0_9ASCO|nr:hypothetical protein PMKS-001791 [Pichia membranifaciens]
MEYSQPEAVGDHRQRPMSCISTHLEPEIQWEKSAKVRATFPESDVLKGDPGVRPFLASGRPERTSVCSIGNGPEEQAVVCIRLSEQAGLLEPHGSRPTPSSCGPGSPTWTSPSTRTPSPTCRSRRRQAPGSCRSRPGRQ